MAGDYSFTIESRALGHILLGFGTLSSMLIWFWLNSESREEIGKGDKFGFSRIWTLTLMAQISQCISSITYLQLDFEDENSGTVHAFQAIANFALGSLVILGVALATAILCIGNPHLFKKLLRIMIPIICLVIYGLVIALSVVSLDLGEKVGFILLMITKALIFAGLVKFYVDLKHKHNLNEYLSSVSSLAICELLNFIGAILIAVFSGQNGWLLGVTVLVHYIPMTVLLPNGIVAPCKKMGDRDGGNTMNTSDNSGDNNNNNQVESDSEVCTCERFVRLLTPIIERKIDTENKRACIIIVAESVRVWFYLLFVVFTLIGVALTFFGQAVGWNDFEYSNNLMYNTFGYSNLCVFYDDPPFSYIGAALFEPILITVLVYIIADILRVYVDYRDGNGKVSKTFWRLYSSFTIIEAITFLCFVQVFATQPDQNITVHHVPFMCLQLGLWLLACQHFLYFKKIKLFTKNSWIYYAGISYLILMALTVFFTVTIDVPNMFEAHLWQHKGWEWTQTLAKINNILFLLTVLLSPLVINFMFVESLQHVEFSVQLKPSFDAKDHQKNQEIELSA